jgi:signal transduction histidine kinase
VTVSIEGPRLPEDVEATAYFVCAEAMANAAKHAQASRVRISGGFDGAVWRVVVADDGVGGADPKGSGLRGLRDRIVALGGSLDVESPAGGGTTVRAVIPVDPAVLAERRGRT